MLVLEEEAVAVVAANLTKMLIGEPLVVEVVVEQVAPQDKVEQVEQQVQVVRLVVQVIKPLVVEVDLVVTLVVDKQLVVQADLVDRHREDLVQVQVEQVQTVLQ